ncbi:MAG: hypothetical protein HKM89_07045 [Gemmatimonadales bacterium]|nr:hypothetical protein [Gemmatimonadales bacterium]
MLFLKSVLFTLLIPGTVTVLLPYLIVGQAAATLDVPWKLPQYLGLVLVVIGAAVLIWSIVDFAAHGRGTLAPVDPPKELVIRGPYRYVRNPMYVGVLTVLLGETIFFQSASLPGMPSSSWLCSWRWSSATKSPRSVSSSVNRILAMWARCAVGFPAGRTGVRIPAVGPRPHALNP